MNYEEKMGALSERVNFHDEEIKRLRKNTHSLVNEQIIFSEALKRSHDAVGSVIESIDSSTELQEKISNKIAEIEKILAANQIRKELAWKFLAGLAFALTIIYTSIQSNLVQGILDILKK